MGICILRCLMAEESVLVKLGDNANVAVPVGAKTVQYNIDFSSYRDIAHDQIGARIAAIRYNRFVADKAYMQSTALAFFTNYNAQQSGSGDLVERMRISPVGNVGIGTANPQNLLDVNGTIRSKEVKIEATGWSDFVFAEDYKLPSLSTVETHIKEHKHLPNIPSEAEVMENGINVGEMQAKLLQKIEELTLYVIEQNKKIERQEKLIEKLESKVN